ncbi:MAG: 3-oxoacyl-[acyl-carrier-protein] reductase [Verrucomicrobiota bacterium]|nr:3-oxoacyl-[acyl-carrier-protein] reductase [Limisphaera sp.]MDW8380736.1 3-oxoacyl-[acyl-carrier-protein] reductase [Verrucomicrobiota bacterium]
MKELEQQVAVVTGGSRGIGRAVALRLAHAGADVAVVARSEEACASTVEAIRAMGRRAWALAADVTQTASVENAAARILGQTGRVDILVNNAGITRDMLLMRMTDEDWDAVLATNLKGAFLFTRALLRPMLKQRNGRIINITSVIGFTGNVGQANYAASKAGLIGFTKSCAREFASRGITVNAVAPGFVETDMTAVLKEEQRQAVLARIPVGSFGKPEDVAHAVWFLALPESRYITGQVLTVDGGLSM